MFLEFYNLREQPFGMTPDPRYLYLSAGHREALASLLYGIEMGRGFLSLVAPPGMGKTTLLFQLLKRWKGYVHSAFLFQTQCDSRELLRYLLEDLGLGNQDRDIVRMHSELNDFLYRQANAGKQVVVFIDEAQNLSDTVLETVRLLSDFEAPDKKLLQIVLAGQPELGLRLSHPSLAQLRQRISIQAQLNPLSEAEVIGYVHHRLQVAGYKGPGLFTPGALAAIAERSQGIPRLINNICFNALSLSCATRSEKVSSEVVQQVVADLSLDSKTVRSQISPPQPPIALFSNFRMQFEAFLSWITENLSGRPLFQKAFLFLMFAGLAIYFGARSAARTDRSSAAIYSDTASALATQSVVAPPAGPDTRISPLSQPKDPGQSSRGGNSITSFTYVVEPHDTLYSLCVSAVGRCDRKVLAEIQKLNPELKNPDQLEVGQQIRLPLDLSK